MHPKGGIFYVEEIGIDGFDFGLDFCFHHSLC